MKKGYVRVMRLFAAASAIVSVILVIGGASSGNPQAKKKPAAAKPKPTATPAAAQPAMSAAAVAGRKVYDAAGCANCHAIGGKGGAAGPDLSREAADASHTGSWLQIQVLTPTKHKPDSTMPPFAGKIKPKDMDALVAYLLTLKDVKTTAGGTGTAPTGYKELGQLRAWAYTTKQAPTEDHVNIDVVMQPGKKALGQVVVSVEQPVKAFYAINLGPMPKKTPLPGMPADAIQQPPSNFAVLFTGGKATVDVDGKYNPGDGKLKNAHLKMDLLGIGTVSPVGNPLGEMKVGFVITEIPSKAVLWRSDLKKVTNGYVRVYAPD